MRLAARRSRVVVLSALVVLVTASCGLFAHHPPIAIIGDSITRLTQDDLRGELGGSWSLSIEATDGATADDMLRQSQRLRGPVYEQAVINVGTNDVLQGRSPADTLAAVDSLIDLFPSARCVHLVTVNEHMYQAGERQAAQTIADLNDGLRARAAASGRVDIIDWSGMVGAYLAAGEPDGAIATDTVHPTDLGQQMLTDAYRDALDACTP